MKENTKRKLLYYWQVLVTEGDIITQEGIRSLEKYTKYDYYDDLPILEELFEKLQDNIELSDLLNSAALEIFSFALYKVANLKETRIQID